MKKRKRKDEEFLKFSQEVSRLFPKLKALHREIHAHPETALQEHRSADLLCGFLEQEGFRVQRGLAGLPTSFRADAGPKGKRPRAGLLCEYDALPGLGHACGHSIIAAASAGAAAVVHRLHPGLAVSVVGTPAEEIGAGKIPLLEAGVFDDLDFAMMVHPSSKRQVVRLFLGVVRRVYTFKGKAAHAAAFPEQGINALDAAVIFYTAVAALRQQMPDQARVHMVITDGGKVPNIIPERSQLVCGIRALDLSVLAELARKVDDCARGAAKATGTKLKIEKVGKVIMPFKPNRTMAAVYEEQIKRAGLVPFHGPEDRNIGSSDISNLSHHLPVIHPHVPVARPGEVNIHTPEFEKAAGGPQGAKSVKEGALLLALTASELLKKPKLLSAVKEEFRKTKVKVPPELLS